MFAYASDPPFARLASHIPKTEVGRLLKTIYPTFVMIETTSPRRSPSRESSRPRLLYPLSPTRSSPTMHLHESAIFTTDSGQASASSPSTTSLTPPSERATLPCLAFLRRHTENNDTFLFDLGIRTAVGLDLLSIHDLWVHFTAMPHWKYDYLQSTSDSSIQTTRSLTEFGMMLERTATSRQRPTRRVVTVSSTWAAITSNSTLNGTLDWWLHTTITNGTSTRETRPTRVAGRHDHLSPCRGALHWGDQSRNGAPGGDDNQPFSDAGFYRPLKKNLKSWRWVPVADWDWELADSAQAPYHTVAEMLRRYHKLLAQRNFHVDGFFDTPE
ncbi:hypothetical protein LXA43DRAFT_1141484 [Ganoderma leucocontextum]|nr:hypothetical protein LXA43DRAFT_1141484 [Ganoderma leucocontextum]